MKRQHDLEQYQAILSLWDSEIGRFYNRQNLYIGLQIAVFAGVLAGSDRAAEAPGMLRIGFGLLVLVSLVNGLIATRGVTTQALTLKVIGEIEDRNEDLDILELSRKHARTNLLSNFILSLVLAWLLVVLWGGVWLYWEATMV